MRHCPINELKNKGKLFTLTLAVLGAVLWLNPLSTDNVVAKEKPQITNVQRGIVNALVLDDYEVLSTGLNLEGTKLGEEISQEYKGLVGTSVTDLDAAYRKNENLADQKYLGKWILISGTISSVERGTGIIQLKSAVKPIKYVKATLKQNKKASPYFSQLKDGETVQLICQGGLRSSSSPTLHNCELLEEVAAPLQEDFKNQLLEALQGKGNLEENAIWVFTILKIEQLLGSKGEQVCLQSPSECLKEIILLRNAELPKGIPQEYLDLGYTKDMLPGE